MHGRNMKIEEWHYTVYYVQEFPIDLSKSLMTTYSHIAKQNNFIFTARRKLNTVKLSI